MTKKLIKHKVGTVALAGRYYLAECPGCGWIGSSEELTEDCGCMQPVGFDYCHAEADEVGAERLLQLLQAGAFNPAENAIGWHTEDYRTDKSATTYDITVAARWREKGWPVSPIFAEAQLPKTHHADKCGKCDKITLGLSGETKWCSYCGGKLEGDSVLVAPMTLEPEEVEKLKEEIGRLTGNIERQQEYIQKAEAARRAERGIVTHDEAVQHVFGHFGDGA